MSTSLSATLPADLKTTNQDRAAARDRVAVSSANKREPKRFGRRGVILLAIGATDTGRRDLLVYQQRRL